MIEDPSIMRPVNYRSDNETVESTGLFRRMYSLSLNVMDLGDDEIVKNSRELDNLSNRFLSVLKSYWQVHSNIIFADSNLLKILKRTD